MYLDPSYAEPCHVKPKAEGNRRIKLLRTWHCSNHDAGSHYNNGNTSQLEENTMDMVDMVIMVVVAIVVSMKICFGPYDGYKSNGNNHKGTI